MSLNTFPARRAVGEDDHDPSPPPPSRPRKAFTIEPEAPGAFRRHRRVWIAGLCAALIAAGAWFALRPPLVEQRLWTATVQSGALRLGVSGHGRLIPSGLQTLSSTTGGSVAVIHALSGAQLAKGDAVLTLRNPDLLMQLSTAETAYAEKRAGQAAVLAELVAKRTEMQTKRDDAGDALSIERLELKAQETLFAAGVSSELQLEKQRAQLAAAERQVRQAAGGIEHLEQSHRIRVRALGADVATARTQLERMQSQVAELTLRAGEAGTLYELKDGLTVGMPVTPGSVLGTVATRADVSAEIRIPSSRAGDVMPGQPVELRVGERTVEGSVERIDPRVQQDQILVSVALPPAMSRGLLAGQPVNGEIITERLQNVIHVERPAGAVEGASMALFELDRRGGRLVRRDVRLGRSGGRSIVIEAGLQPGNEIVLSDMAKHARHRSLRFAPPKPR
ncbi:MAG: efflux RND transporter periplasmic adaptor subunit [Thermoanaerobaculia bacterium]